MNTTTAIVVCFGFLVVAFIVVLLAYRSRGKGEVKGPFGMGMKVEGSNEPASQPGVTVKDAQTDRGNIHVKDETGKGAVAEKLKAGGDIDVSSSPGSPPKT